MNRTLFTQLRTQQKKLNVKRTHTHIHGTQRHTSTQLKSLKIVQQQTK